MKRRIIGKVHINEPLPTAGHSPMYLMHKFFARKQADVIREYIRCYTNEGDLVIDPFCGSGVVIGEALRLNRKVIGIDINPVSIFITRNTVKSIASELIIREMERIQDDLSKKIKGLYLTHCRKCKNRSISAICFTWIDNQLKDVRYQCPEHGKRIDPISEEDENLYTQIQNGEHEEFFTPEGVCKFWYPKNRLYYRNGTPFLKKERYETIPDLYTMRNLVALAQLYDRIESIKNEDLQAAFKFAFSSITHLASRMTPVRTSRPFSSAWVQQSYWYVPHYMESNIWYLFERAIFGRQGLLKAKNNLPPHFNSKREAMKISQLTNDPSYDFLLINLAIDRISSIEKNSVDYVITDPPYGKSIQYAELLYMWGCWLKLMDRFDEIARDEIIINPHQDKTKLDYERQLMQAFKKIFELLKPGKYCTVTFHNPNFNYRNILLRAVLSAGFEFEKVIYQPPSRPSAKSLLQPFGSLGGDYFFRFKKPTSFQKKSTTEPFTPEDLETLIVNATKQILKDQGKPCHFTVIQNSIDPILYEELRTRNLLTDFRIENLEKILSKYLGTEFQLIDVEIGKYKKKKLRAKGWWFKDPV
ncbi:MAG: DNA methyltransferase [Candidatus Helarchaeota archaeon]